jgi:beta-lactamase regulating signal transducer with metallopeptidase domain
MTSLSVETLSTTFAAASVALQLFLKITVILGAALLLDSLLHRRFVLASASLWNATLVLLAVLPLACLALPAVIVQTEHAQHQAVAATTTLPAPQVVSVDDSSSTPLAAAKPASPSAHQWIDAGMIDAVPATSTAPSRWLPTVALSTYLLGCAVHFIRLLSAMCAVMRLRRSSNDVADASWIRALAQWKGHCGIRRSVRLCSSKGVQVPLVVGWLRPTIMLPNDLAASADAPAKDAILLHELAHIARVDFAWQLLERAIGMLLWFHPLLWLTQRRIAFARERACDEFVVHQMGGAQRYIDTLLEIATRLSQRSSLSLGIAVLRSSHLGERLACLQASRGRAACQLGRWPRRAVLAVVLVSAGWAGRAAIADPTVPRVEGLTVDAQAMLDEFETEAKRLRDDAERQIATKRADVEVQLRALQTRYTRQDNLDAAVAIRDQIRLLRALSAADGAPLSIKPDPGTMSSYASAVGQTFFFKVAGSTAGGVWGTDQYTHDSSVAVAAVHAGALRPGEVGVVKVSMQPSIPFYRGESRNGVTSYDWQNSGIYSSFTVERAPKAIELMAKDLALPTVLDEREFAYGYVPGTSSITAYRPRVGVRHDVSAGFTPPSPTDLFACRNTQQEFCDFVVTAAVDPMRPIWGSDIYTDDSWLDIAVVHAGLLKAGESGLVRVTFLPGQSQYDAATRHGVTSMSYGSFSGSYRVTLRQPFGRVRFGKPIELPDGTRINVREKPHTRIHIGSDAGLNSATGEAYRQKVTEFFEAEQRGAAENDAEGNKPEVKEEKY